MRRVGVPTSVGRRPRGRLAVLAALCVLALAGLPAQAADLDWDVYVHDVKGIAHAVEILQAEAKRRGATEVVVAFDSISFDPPQSNNEYTDAHYYKQDLEEWISALDRWSADLEGEMHVLATLGPSALRVGQPGCWQSLRRALDSGWFRNDDFKGFEPALDWIRRWAPKKGGMLVLIASELTPERWGERPLFLHDRGLWRRHLRCPGTYWDEEAIGNMLESRGCPLYVVAPEVCFGDERPLPALPALPWASRPMRPSGGSDRLRKLLGGGDLPKLPREDPYGHPLPEPVKKALFGGRRFQSITPLFFPDYGGIRILNNHTPSAYGYWPYARAAARTGGRYLAYPFPYAPWLDTCPRDNRQLKAMAPELVRRSAYLKARAGDPAHAALCRAEALVREDTPWFDVSLGRVARGWDAVESVRPLKRTAGWRARRKPYDLHLGGRRRTLQREGERLAELCAEYDRAMRILDKALARAREGKLDSAHPRAIADLRLGRFWFSMSAFHLEALGIYLREIERFAPPGVDPELELDITYTPAIKLSDCLDAYDGRTFPLEEESRYRRLLLRGDSVPLGLGVWPRDQVIPGQQSNLLDIDEDDPNYRAKRSLSSVLRYLDRRLMGRAMDMIQAARRVMAHHAKTPWGWTTYYSIAYTFVFVPVPAWGDRHPRTGPPPEAEEPPPWSPTPRGGGGSSPGGPTTPR